MPWLDAVCCVAAQARHRMVRECIRGSYRYNENPLTGLCYTFSEAIYHLSEDPLEPWWVRYGYRQHQTHWFLKLAADGTIVDVTGSQFADMDAYAMYDHARRRAFLTKEPSKRAQVVIDLVSRENYWEHAADRYSPEQAEQRYVNATKWRNDDLASQRKARDSNPQDT